ncbi:hypothetical protein L3i20_v243650 [Paenibacillus sp. L3-i20]|nr:hypothetical protein L3i20_v243650 [Paenibacillus sp. L3-i20]
MCFFAISVDKVIGRMYKIMIQQDHVIWVEGYVLKLIGMIVLFMKTFTRLR